MAEILNKITIKDCKASPDMEIVVVDGKQVPRAKGKQHLLRILGVTNGVKRGESDFGPWVKFLGSFEATNIKTGEIYSSSQCMLPEAVAGLISVAVGTHNNQVEFAIDVYAEPANSQIGYQYRVKPLMETAENDPLELMKARLLKGIEMNQPVRAIVTQSKISENPQTVEQAQAEAAKVEEKFEQSKKPGKK